VTPCLPDGDRNTGQIESMKYHFPILILISLIFFASCAYKAPRAPEREAAGRPEEALFSKAENLFGEKKYPDALNTYQEVLSLYPQSAFAAAALLKIGTLYRALGEDQKARQSYERLLEEYPESGFAAEAMQALLSLLYARGEYQQVVSISPNALAKAVLDSHIARIYELSGGSYEALQMPVLAVKSYIRGMSYADEPSQKVFSEKLKNVAAKLPESELEALLSTVETEAPVGYLLYQLALRKVADEKYTDAKKILAELIHRFPDHDEAVRARETLENLGKTILYRRHTLGCLLPLSGPYRIYGLRALKGIELALVQFNAHNSGLKAGIIVRDTASDIKTAAAAAKELIQERVAAIIGPVTVPELAVLEAQKKGIPIITLSQKEGVTSAGDYVFRHFITPEIQVETLVAYAMETLKLTRFAILYPKEKYGRTFMSLFRSRVLGRGGIITAAEIYEPTQTDFTGVIKKLAALFSNSPTEPETQAPSQTDDETTLRMDQTGVGEDIPQKKMDIPSAGFDAIFIPDSPKKVGLIIPQLAYYDIKGVALLGTNLWHSEQLIQMARESVQGAVLVDVFNPGSPDTAVRAFVETFRRIYGETPGFIEAIAYDTAMILFNASRQLHIQTHSALREELSARTAYHGVTGFTTFGAGGEARKTLYLLKIEGDGFLQIESGPVYGFD